MEKQKCPEIRFKGFDLKWEKNILGDITTFVNGRAYSQEELLKKGKYPVLRVGNFNTNSHWYYSDLELGERYYAEDGDLLYTWSTIFSPYIWKGEKVIYHYHIWKVELSKKLDKLFTFHFLKADEISLTNNTNGSTMIHVTKGEMEGKIIHIPVLTEQIPIGNFFQNLDQSIALQEKKFAQTQNLKKAMLEKMFPKVGSTQPEIRLKGFGGEWDVDTIGNVLQEVFRPINLDNEAKYRLVTVKRRNGGIAERAILKGKDILVKSQFEVKAGDYIISKRQVVHGATGLVPYELDGSIVSNEYLVGQGTDKLNIEFFALLSTLPEMYKKFFLSSYGVDIEKLFFDVNDWKKREISLPCLAEQIQISKFFKQLDETLALQQQQLQTLKNLKQAFLEKMFV